MKKKEKRTQKKPFNGECFNCRRKGHSSYEHNDKAKETEKAELKKITLSYVPSLTMMRNR